MTIVLGFVRTIFVTNQPTNKEAVIVTQTAPEVKTDQQRLEEWIQDFATKYPHGYIVSQHEQNGYHDSYFSETLYLADKNEYVTVNTGATAYGCVAYSSLLPWLKDAPQEVKQKYVDFYKANRRAEIVQQVRRSALNFCSEIKMGSKIRLRKTKKSKGETYEQDSVATVFWIGKDKFSDFKRFGLEFEDKRKAFFTQGEWVEFLPQYVPNSEKEALFVEQCCEFMKNVLTYEQVSQGRGGQFPSREGGYESHAEEFVDKV